MSVRKRIDKYLLRVQKSVIKNVYNVILRLNGLVKILVKIFVRHIEQLVKMGNGWI